jgi:hypothetical protein
MFARVATLILVAVAVCISAQPAADAGAEVPQPPAPACDCSAVEAALSAKDVELSTVKQVRGARRRFCCARVRSAERGVLVSAVGVNRQGSCAPRVPRSAADE